MSPPFLRGMTRAVTRTTTLTRTAVLALLLTFATGAATPATAGAACRDGVELKRKTTSDTVRTTLVRCGEGGRRTLDRAVWRGRGRSARGAIITDGARRGTSLAIARLRATGRRAPTGEVRLLSTRSRKIRFRDTRATGVADVALAEGGRFAWVLGGRLRLREPSGKVTTLEARGAVDVTVEDGRTLRWGDPSSATPFTYRDLRPFPAATCPRRGAFKAVQETPEVLITRADYRGDEREWALRACLKATGRDVVVGSGYSREDDSSGPGIAAISGPLVVTTSGEYDRYSGCSDVALRVIDLRTRRTVRRGVVEDDRECLVEPRKDQALVVTPSGGVAWVSTALDPAVTASQPVVRGLRADGTIAVLESPSASPITGLRVQGETVFWTRDGVERSAAL